MSIKDLLETVESQDLEKRNVAFDTDGIIFLSAYKYRDEPNNEEVIYADVFMRIQSIEAEIWKSYAVDKTILALTSKKNFRHELTDKWKQDRVKNEEDMNDKQLASHREALRLRKMVSHTKVLLRERMASSPNYTIIVNNVSEADDIVIDLANREGYLVVAMDSDVINQCPTPVFNYHKSHWKWEHEGLEYDAIFKSIIHSTITGGHNGSFGVKGMGKVGAVKFIDKLVSGEKGLEDYVNLFETSDDCLVNFRVASCRQVIDGKVKLASINDINDGIEMLSVF